MWQAAVPTADFSGVTFTIVDLAGDLLGYTLGRSVAIDPTADGWGWSSPEYSGPDRMSLLTVVLHELGMALGFSEDDPAEPYVMARTLTAGVQAPPPLLALAAGTATSSTSVAAVPAIALITAPAVAAPRPSAPRPATPAVRNVRVILRGIGRFAAPALRLSSRIR